uniref:Uncharacterized protein n=1 Tax=Setaria italica TaxID=4555 RepID=K3Z155_SETIT
MYNVLNFTSSCNIHLMQFCNFCCEILMYRQLPSKRKLPSDADIHSLLKICHHLQYCVLMGSKEFICIVFSRYLLPSVKVFP